MNLTLCWTVAAIALRGSRLRAGYSQEQLAERLSDFVGEDVTAECLAEWESGTVPIPGWVLPALDFTIGVPYDVRQGTTRDLRGLLARVRDKLRGVPAKSLCVTPVAGVVGYLLQQFGN